MSDVFIGDPAKVYNITNFCQPLIITAFFKIKIIRDDRGLLFHRVVLKPSFAIQTVSVIRNPAEKPAASDPHAMLILPYVCEFVDKNMLSVY